MPVELLLKGGTVRAIVHWDLPIMRRVARPVASFDEQLWALVRDMFATNDAAEGAGLAAPQIGVDAAVFVFDCLDEHGVRQRGVMCNPTITRTSGDDFVDIEGCLSLPGAHARLARPSAAVCEGQDQNGDPVTVVGSGTLARCLQHETDHLNGVVIENHLNRRELQAMRRQHREHAWLYPADWPVSPPLS